MAIVNMLEAFARARLMTNRTNGGSAYIIIWSVGAYEARLHTDQSI